MLCMGYPEMTMELCGSRRQEQHAGRGPPQYFPFQRHQYGALINTSSRLTSLTGDIDIGPERTEADRAKPDVQTLDLEGHQAEQ